MTVNLPACLSVLTLVLSSISIGGAEEQRLLRPVTVKGKAVSSGAGNDNFKRGATRRNIRYTAKSVAVELYTPNATVERPLAVEVFFLGRDGTSHTEWIYDCGLQFSTEPIETLRFDSKELFTEDKEVSTWSFDTSSTTTVDVLEKRVLTGSSMAGWIVRCRSDGEIVQITASSRPLEELTKSNSNILDHIILGRFGDLRQTLQLDQKLYGILQSGETSWFESLESCQIMGAHLASISSPETNTALANALKGESFGDLAWIGGFRYGNFYWTDDSAPGFLNFGAPAASDLHAYVALEHTGSWAWLEDEAAVPINGFICYWQNSKHLDWLIQQGYLEKPASNQPRNLEHPAELEKGYDEHPFPDFDWANISERIRSGNLAPTAYAGGESSFGNPIRDLSSQPSLLVGFDVYLSSTIPKEIVNLVPLFCSASGEVTRGIPRSKANGTPTRILAKPGYVVSGVAVHGEDKISKVKFQFSRIEGATVSDADRYQSDYFGQSEADVAQVLRIESGFPVGLDGSVGHDSVGNFCLLSTTP